MPRIALVFFIIFALVWSCLTLLIGVLAIRGIVLEWRSRSFVQTTGQILTSKVQAHAGHRGTSYTPEITYTYTVDGRKFTGSKVRAGFATGSSGHWARDVVEQHPVDSNASVFYDPASPSMAVLEKGISGQDLFILLFLTPFLAITATIWVIVWDAIKGLRKDLVAGGVKLIPYTTGVRVRLPSFPPIGAGGLALGGSSIVAIFAITFSTNMDPSVGTVLMTWCFILGFSAFIFMRRWKRVHSGAEDLVIDEGSYMITLPRTFGRSVEQRVAVNELASVVVDCIERRSNKRKSRTWAPALRFKEASRKERLAEWGDQRKAEAFAAWLADKLRVDVGN